MHDVRVNFLRSKDAQKQLAQTSLRELLGTLSTNGKLSWLKMENRNTLCASLFFGL